MQTNKVQLFVLHFAGGNKYSFQFLKEAIGSQMEFYALELPGRGARTREPLLNTREDAIEDYLRQIKALRKKAPFVIYGHSMGATLGLHVAKELQKLNDAPSALIVSGNPGPGKGEKKERYLMTDKDFKKELLELGGVPEEVLNSEELYEFFCPILRADFEILEKAPVEGLGLKVKTPIFALMGSREEEVDGIDNWEKYTDRFLGSKVLEGNHFFIYDHVATIHQTIISSYDRSLVV